jgi:RNA-directed DNA polymerase
VKYEKVLERVYEPGRLLAAWQQVKRNAGAAGIDEMSVQEFERKETELLRCIYRKLKAGTYRFKPARRVLIPKESSSKMRKLGIPTVVPYCTSHSDL